MAASGKRCDVVRTAQKSRLFMEVVLRRERDGSPRRDFPESFGKWTPYATASEVGVGGSLVRGFKELLRASASGSVMIDGKATRPHRKDTGAGDIGKQATDRYRWFNADQSQNPDGEDSARPVRDESRSTGRHRPAPAGTGGGRSEFNSAN